MWFGVDFMLLMNTRRLLLFNVVFWLLAAGVLLVNAWPSARNHIDVAYVRYAYFVLVGLLASGAMILMFASDWFARQQRKMVSGLFV